MMFMGMGSLSGTLILASISNLKNRRVFLIVNGLLWGIALYLFSGCTSYMTTLPAIFFVGFLSSVFMALNNTLMQVKSSNEMRGRMVSLTMMTFGVMPLSAVPFGALAERIGTPDSLMLAGLLLCAFIVLFFFCAPAFRNSTK
jgi:predicted MFS family arabinose efflux permease